MRRQSQPRVLQQRRGLRWCEGQLGGAQLAEPARQTQPGQGQRWIEPAGQHEPDGRGLDADEGAQAVQCARVDQFLHVVEDQSDRLRQVLQRSGELGDEIRVGRGPAGHRACERTRRRCRRARGECGQDRGPQPTAGRCRRGRGRPTPCPPRCWFGPSRPAAGSSRSRQARRPERCQRPLRRPDPRRDPLAARSPAGAVEP